MTREALERQKSQAKRLQTREETYTRMTLTVAALAKLFSIGAAVGAVLGAIAAAMIAGPIQGEAFGAILGAVISGICTIIGAIVQSKGR